MRRHTQNIEDCEHCGKVFENGEDYWKDARNKCYCVDNACGWEDDETSDEALPIADVGGSCKPHICGLHGYNPIIDPPCPACKTN